MNKLSILSLLLIMSCAGTKTNTKFLNIGANEVVTVTPYDYSYPTDTTFKILSWNVEHFVDQFDDPYIDNAREDTPPENMELRRELFLKALKKADADIVVLQEFESAKYLKQLALDSLPEMGYRFFADIPSHNWYMNVVIMSKFPMGIMYGYGNVNTPLPNYLTETGVQESQNQINTRMWSIEIYPAADYEILLTGVHLKAGRSDRDVAMRKGQLNFLVSQFNRMLAENPDRNMVIVGDFNAIPTSEELSILINNDNLKNAFIDPIDPEIYSHPANDLRWRLDYMLVNKNMHPEIIDNTIKVDNFFPADTMRIISDHLPITGSFLKKD
ncbi:endonuclease/exonuclease/phosphatase family protein [Aquiflexum lacus]|uniref:endonuclease/exonuclease/phosphatase family protein n=1 Tax=Aquiflexum lacus TaxID=2483805 RepID=UPI001894CBDD|nr:endonuclease/exonuclease/phosphatase family protein [Aquiflexum lacus]